MVTDNTVFRFAVLCTSKQLGGALAALHGMVMEVSPPQMAPQATAGNGRVAQISKGDLIELFLQWLKAKKLAEFKAPHVREFLQEHGRSQKSYSYLLTHLKKRGQVKKIGGGTTNVVWVVHAAKAKRPPLPKKAPRPRVRTRVIGNASKPETAKAEA